MFLAQLFLKFKLKIVRMAKNRPRGEGERLEDRFYRAGKHKRKVYSKAQWKSLHRRSQQWVSRQLSPYREEWEKRADRVNRITLQRRFQTRWLSEIEYADRGAQWLRYRIAELEAEHDYRKRQGDMFHVFNPVLRFKKRRIDRMLRRLTDVPAEMNAIQEEIRRLGRLSANTKVMFKNQQKHLNRLTIRNEKWREEVRRLRKNRTDSIKKAERSHQGTVTISQFLEQKLKLGIVNEESIEREMWPINMEYVEHHMEAVNAELELWTFWHRRAVEEGAYKKYVKELSRRIYNARENYRRAKTQRDFWRRHKPRGLE